MNGDLMPEIGAVRQACLGERYNRIGRSLNRKGNEKRKAEFTELEDYFFQLLTYVISNQTQAGWWNPGHALRNVITAHALRHLHKIGIPLEARWNLVGSTSGEGNLFRAAKLLINAFNPRKPTAKWGTDVWDDCYILLALLQVLPNMDSNTVQKWDSKLRKRFQENLVKSLNWFKGQFDEKGFKNKSVTGAEWYGPGFYAAAIELFAHPAVKEVYPQAENMVSNLTTAVGKMLSERSKGPGDPKWYDRFAWHAGQILVTWHDGKTSDPSGLEQIMNDLFENLKSSQNKKGVWDDNGRWQTPEYQVYFTVRGLSACYALTKDKAFLASENIRLAHEFLLATFRQSSEGELVDPKGSINALAAFQKLFEFRLHDIYPNALVALTQRTKQLGLLETIGTGNESESELLKQIRTNARKQLEGRGEDAIELLGVNSQLYESLKETENDEFLKEFTGGRSTTSLDNERNEILEDLRRCLSTTLTETRSKLSNNLIMRLWDTDGFLNFKPLIEHLSVLEQDRAFYKYYRDHLNHPLLLFLLGAYIYYNCSTFKEKINDEMREIYDQKHIKFDRKDLPHEFLFRWKLISTFHDIGYLFEVDPFKDKSDKKSDLIKKSWQVIDGFRKDFLSDYFMQTLEPARSPGMDEKQAQRAREKKVKELADTMYARLGPHPEEVTGEEELKNLSTGGHSGDSFKLISQFVKPGHIGPDLIKNYFYLCGATEVLEESDGKLVQQRTAFYDHGVMSALILLKASDIQRHYLKKLSDQAFAGELDNYPEVSTILREKKTMNHLNPDQFFVRFSHVAGAIALHNISPRLYRQDQCAKFDASDKRTGEGIAKAFYPEPTNTSAGYAISLDENPLSYLTALADTLQDWDRHSFRRLSFTEDADPLTSSELTIDVAEDNKILVSPLTEAAKDKYKKLMSPKSMGHLLGWENYLKVSDDITQL
ncbi:MAG: hypothetical protein AABM67_07120 [Acidobacteriota bacterium]